MLAGTPANRNRHHVICDRLSRSEVMAREIITRRISISHYGREVENIASQYTIGKRFDLGKKRLMKTDPALVAEWEEWRARFQVKGDGTRKPSKAEPKPRKCLRCRIVLPRDRYNKYCKRCAGQVRIIAILGELTIEDVSDFVYF